MTASKTPAAAGPNHQIHWSRNPLALYPIHSSPPFPSPFPSPFPTSKRPLSGALTRQIPPQNPQPQTPRRIHPRARIPLHHATTRKAHHRQPRRNQQRPQLRAKQQRLAGIETDAESQVQQREGGARFVEEDLACGERGGGVEAPCPMEEDGAVVAEDGEEEESGGGGAEGLGEEVDCCCWGGEGGG